MDRSMDHFVKRNWNVCSRVSNQGSHDAMDRIFVCDGTNEY